MDEIVAAHSNGALRVEAAHEGQVIDFARRTAVTAGGANDPARAVGTQGLATEGPECASQYRAEVAQDTVREVGAAQCDRRPPRPTRKVNHMSKLRRIANSTALLAGPVIFFFIETAGRLWP